MKPLILLILSIALMHSEETRIWIPVNQMEIRFKGEIAEKFQGNNEDGIYKYSMMTPMSTVITIFVEDPKSQNASNDDVLKFYWAKSSKNPKIDQASIKIGRLGSFSKVDYVIKASIEGKEFSFNHSNVYFASKGKWVDVHVSYNSPASEINQLNKMAFEKTFEVR